jgi:hypothetical protein
VGVAVLVRLGVNEGGAVWVVVGEAVQVAGRMGVGGRRVFVAVPMAVPVEDGAAPGGGCVGAPTSVSLRTGLRVAVSPTSTGAAVVGWALGGHTDA